MLARNPSPMRGFARGGRSALIALSIVSTMSIAPASDLTVDRILSPEFSARVPSLRFSEDGKGVLSTEPATGGGRDIVRRELIGDGREVLVAASDLIPAGEESSLTIEAYHFSKDERRVLIFTNSRPVWRRNTRGDYWVFDREAKTLKQVGADAPKSSLMFAKFSPDGERVAYLSENDLFVQRVDDLSIVRLTTAGSDTVFHGTGDWVYEEEFGLRDGFSWSPDGEWIAYFKIDDAGLERFPMIDNLTRPYPSIKTFPHPKPGTTNPACTMHMVQASGGSPLTVDLPGSARDNYIATMRWVGGSDGASESASESSLLLQRFDRRHQVRTLLEVDPRRGWERVVFQDEDEAWIDADDANTVLSDGRVLVLSEQDGWRHMYVSGDEGVAKRLTDGPYDVTAVDHVDEESGLIFFTASPDDATQRYLYCISIAGGKARRVTPEGSPGTHSYRFAPDGKHAVHTMSSFGVPSVTELVRLPSHEVVRSMEENRKVRGNLAKLRDVQSEFFQVEIDEGVSLDGWMMFPPGFNPTLKYPVLIYVYGEPAAQTVKDSWGGRTHMWHRMVAERGYIVLSIDNRGTPAPKGRAWRKAAYEKIGITACLDQAAALRALLEEREYLDEDRIAIWGWSGGGSMTLNQMFRYPDLYHAGMAIAFVADQLLYDTIYQERYMGLPQDNAKGYRDGSPITHAKGLEGDLLLIYGTGDDNTHYQNMEVLVDELVAHGKQFEMMAYPNRRHGLSQGRNTLRHLYSMMERFLLEHVEPGASDGD